MRETIRDNHGNILGYFETLSDGRVRVTDKHSNLCGYVKKDGTYNKAGQRVSPQQVPGLLLESN